MSLDDKIKPLYLLKDQAVEHLKQKEYKAAEIYFSDMLKKFKSLIEQIDSQEIMQKIIIQIKIPAHKNLSLCYLKLQIYNKCIQHCRQALDIQPNNIKILYRIGKAYIEIGNYYQAEKYLKKGYILDPNQKEIMKALEMIQSKNNQQTVKKPENQSLLSKILYLCILPILWMKWILSYCYQLTSKKKQ